MSTWRILIRGLHAIGGEGELLQFGETDRASYGALDMMRRAGLIRIVARDQRSRYALTRLGRDWCDGFVREFQVRTGPTRTTKEYRTGPMVGMRFGATWLAPLRPTELERQAADAAGAALAAMRQGQGAAA